MMKPAIRPTILGRTILGLAIAGAMTPVSARASEADEMAVMEAANGFYAALNAMFIGDLTLMKQVWSHADDVTYMGPGGGFQAGWRQVLAAWEDQAKRKLGGEVRPEDVRVTVGRDLAVVHNFERGANVDAEGKREEVSIRATNVFRNENGVWKMIGHHTDLLPYLDE